MSVHWIRNRERGSVFAMKLIARIALFFGRPVSRALLYPICLYFMLFARPGVRASRRFLTRALGRNATWRDIFRHHFTFASVLLDRALLMAGARPKLEAEGENVDLVFDMAERGQGCLLLGAHMGSFDVTRQLGQDRRQIVVNMMMYEENAQKVNTVLEGLGGRERMKVIQIGTFDSLIRAKDRLDRGEWVGILGDRVFDPQRVVRVPFFGVETAFPTGPFLVASALKVPVVLFFCFYLGGNRYRECFELFADELTLDRGQREAQLEQWVRRYAARLEDYCRRAPYNWFNFYDYWGEDRPAEAKPMVHSTAA